MCHALTCHPGVPCDTGVQLPARGSLRPAHRNPSRLLRRTTRRPGGRRFPLSDCRRRRHRRNPFDLSGGHHRHEPGAAELLERCPVAHPGRTTHRLSAAQGCPGGARGPVALSTSTRNLGHLDTSCVAPNTHGTPFRSRSRRPARPRKGCLMSGIRGPPLLRRGRPEALTPRRLPVWVPATELEHLGHPRLIDRIAGPASASARLRKRDIGRAQDPAFPPSTAPPGGGLTSRDSSPCSARLAAPEPGRRGGKKKHVEVCPRLHHARSPHSRAATQLGYELLSAPRPCQA